MSKGRMASPEDASVKTSRSEAFLSVEDIDFDALIRDKQFHPSPDAWEDQVLYFLLVDRFSDNRENDYRGIDGHYVRDGETPRFAVSRDVNNAVKTEEDAQRWREAGQKFVGGNLKGLMSKLGYLKRLGVGAVWISPILKQAPWAEGNYHGYGTQNFLDIDPRFGTREDLRALVQAAHERGIHVILDIIVNHAGDVFAYEGENGPNWTGEQFPVAAFRDAKALPNIPFGSVDTRKHPEAWPDGAVWPAELQHPECFLRKGQMVNWEHFPEYVEGDFFSLKALNLGEGDENDFHPSPALEALIKVYQYWIAYADLDGFRLDTVKHMGPGPVCHFANEIKKFAESIGKRNFYLIGEIAGGRGHAHSMLQRTCLDAALGIDEIPERIRDVATGRAKPSEYFCLFVNTRKEESESEDPLWWRNRVVTFFDDHDQVGKPVKGRFAAEFGKDRKVAEAALLRAVGLDLTTVGIPCLYYGSEQGFNGHALGSDGGDTFIREAMFGGEFGSYASRGRHFFNETGHLYKEIARICEVRRERPALRRGRQFLRPISENGKDFGDPEDRSGSGVYKGVIAWSRLLDVDDMICAINTDDEKPRSVWVTVDAERHAPGSRPMRCLYSTDPEQVGTECCPPEARNGAAICLTVPAGGFVIFQ